MIRDNVIDEYFEWLFGIACGDMFGGDISYRKLLMHLHSITFRYSIHNDENRAVDGEGMRYRFAITECEGCDVDMVLENLAGPCSVFEMMIALAIRCEESIMDDPVMGNRTRQWFWGMITNLGLGAMMDNRFDKGKVDEIVERFLDGDYEPNGKGGLFTVRNCKCDLRDVEIWRQMLWFLDTIM